MPIIGEPPERNAKQRVENAKGGPIEKAKVAVGEVEVGFQILGKDGEDLPVDKIEDIDEHEHAEHIPGIGFGLVIFGRADRLTLRCFGHLALPELFS